MVITERSDFRVRLEKNKALMPKNLVNLKFVREQIKDGNVIDSSVYDFYIDENDIESLIDAIRNS